MPSAETGAAMTPHRIQLVDEYDTRRVAFALLEKVTHSGSTDTDKHLDEFATTDGKERNISLAGYGPSQ